MAKNLSKARLQDLPKSISSIPDMRVTRGARWEGSHGSKRVDKSITSAKYYLKIVVGSTKSVAGGWAAYLLLYAPALTQTIAFNLDHARELLAGTNLQGKR